MNISKQCIVNLQVSSPFVSINNATGLTTFSNVRYLKDGVVVTSPSATYVEVGSGLYLLRFTPSQTGFWQIFIEGKVQIELDVVERTFNSILSDLSDQALGSWTWDKTSGLLTLFKSDSSTLATYNIVEDLSNASRERIS